MCLSSFGGLSGVLLKGVLFFVCSYKKTNSQALSTTNIIQVFYCN